MNKIQNLKFKIKNLFSNRRFWIGLGAGSFILAAFLIFFLILPALRLYQSTQKLESAARELVAAVQAQNLAKSKEALGKTKSGILEFDRNLSGLSWTRFIPFLGGYWLDAEHGSKAGILGIEALEVLIPTLEPYADILGFDGGISQAADGAKTAEERIEFIVETIDDIAPKLGEVGEKLEKAASLVNQINPSRYPQDFGGRPLRATIARGINLVNEIATLVIDGRPLLEQAPYLLGIDETRTYLVIFQNDKELRPTGGFLTAYSLMRVKDGKIQPVSSNDIYNLDARYTGRVTPPSPIARYIKGPYLVSRRWFLRDMNWSPDFAVSMELFSEEVAKAGIRNIDGIIAVDTEVLVRFLDVIGPIGVPGYGTYSTKEVSACRCPQVIYELETFADIEGPVVWDPVTGKIVYGRILDNRKAILGPLMNSVLANALGQPKDKLPALFEAVFSSVREKHVLFYMFDNEVQKALEVFGLAGRIKDYDGDFLNINDANLGGRKANLYVEQEVKLEVTRKGDGQENKLEITYKNPKEHDGWLNSVLRNYVRVYVPKEAKLIEVNGLEEKEETYEELGKTVFAGFFELRPLGVAKITFRYEIPKASKGDYKLLIQKQPGTKEAFFTLVLDGRTQEFRLREDHEIRF